MLASFLNVEQTVTKVFNLFTAASGTDPELEFTVKPRIISRLFNTLGLNSGIIFPGSVVRHVTGNDKDYLRKIPRVVW